MIQMSAWSIDIVSDYINVQSIIFMFNYTVFTILTSFTSSVSVHNDGFVEYNKWNENKMICGQYGHLRCEC